MVLVEICNVGKTFFRLIHSIEVEEGDVLAKIASRAAGFAEKMRRRKRKRRTASVDIKITIY